MPWKTIPFAVPMLALATTITLSSATLRAEEPRRTTGSLKGRVLDERHVPVAGATVMLTAPSRAVVQVTDAQGRFAFRGLVPGGYAASASRRGFATREYGAVTIEPGREATLAVTLARRENSSSTETTILDSSRTSTQTTVTREMLDSLPAARNPWTVLQQAPGILLDRVNVGGNENGTAQTFTSAGGSQHQFTVDGMPISDPAALGSSPAHYDLDSIQEIQIQTGGARAEFGSSGATINLVTRQGGNTWQKSFGFYGGPGASGSGVADPGGFLLNHRADYGASLGGPIVKDRLWFWGSYGGQQIGRDTSAAGVKIPAGFTSNAVHGNVNVKLDDKWRFNVQSHVSPYHYAGDGAAAGVSRDGTWTRSATPFNFTIGSSMTVTPDLSFTANYGIVGTGYGLKPFGTGVPYDNPSGILTGGNYTFNAGRSSQQFRFDGVSDCPRMTIPQKLRFGFGYRNMTVDSSYSWASHMLSLSEGSSTNPFVIFPLDLTTSTGIKYLSFYAQDTLTKGNLTLDLGLRFDKQSATNNPSDAFANPLQPTVAPGAHFAGSDAGFSWSSITPRLGLTYALGQERKTLLRASYSRFADQLGARTAAWLNPLGSSTYSYVYGAAFEAIQDTNLNHVPDPGEQTSGFFNFGSRGNSLDFLKPLNQVNPKLRAPMRSEFNVGIEHQLRQEFIVGLNLTYRKITDILDKVDLVRDGSGAVRPATLNDWLQTGAMTGTDFDGLSFSVPTWTWKSPLVQIGGQLLANGERSQSYTGVSCTFNRRLANRWMLRGNFTFSDWSWNDPPGVQTKPFDVLGSGDNDGAPFSMMSESLNKQGVYIGSHYSYDINALYQIRPDIDLSATIDGRQGYVLPQYLAFAGAGFRAIPYQIGEIDKFRLDNLNIFNLRLAKTGLKLAGGKATGTIEIDVNNLLNAAPPQQAESNLAKTSRGKPTELMGGRAIGFGFSVKY